MDYKIRDICSSLRISSKTFYKRLDILKQCISSEELNSNEYFYKNDNKFFVTDKGFEWLRNFDSNRQDSTKKDNKKQESTKNNNDVAIIYQNQIIDMYKSRIEYLETENKRLLDIIAVKEQREIAELAQKSLSSETKEVKKNNFFSRIFSFFKSDSEEK